MTGVQVRSLGDIKSVVGNVIVTALIINKSESNIFLSKDSNEFRGVINFTLRDSKQHIVNCKCWGSKEKIDEYQRQLKLCDVVDVINAKIVSQSLSTPLELHSDGEGRFVPQPTLNYTLVVNEGVGYLEKHNESDKEVWNRLQTLAHLPHSPPGDSLKLIDVRCGGLRGKTISTKYINLLVALIHVQPIKHLRSTRTAGQVLHCLELLVIDATCSEGMVLTMWNRDWIQRARETWVPRKTILQLIDVRVSYSDYYKCATLNHAPCTYIYENPPGVETKALLAFAAKVPQLDISFFGVEQLPPAEEIRTPMTVKQIYRLAMDELSNVEQFTAVLYAMLTKFDIDGQTDSIFGKKCKSCLHLIANNRSECLNEQCQLEFSLNDNGRQYEYFFSINLHFTDHTGTLIEARLTNAVAERVIGQSVEQYMHLPHSRKTALKWRFLLNHFAVKLFIRKPGVMRRQIAVAVVDMQMVDLNEYADKILVF